MKRLLRPLSRRLRNLIQTKKEHRHALVGPPSLWKMKRDFQIQFLKNMNLQPDHYFFEIGCGTLRGGLPIIDYLQDGHYFGADVRGEVLDEGRKELTEARMESKKSTLLLAPDISKLKLNRKFDYIWAFSVLIHMSDKILNDTLLFVSRHLSDKGIFYANVNIENSHKIEDGNWQEFPLVVRSFDFYNQACANNGLFVSDIGMLKEHGHIANVESQDSQRMLKIIKTK